ncbi:MAG: glycoside hydrolase family 32 protein [Planctomycetes bacterium]|nr:glycoside hydrolase family 32 protein [Planctomycetota bacterium]
MNVASEPYRPLVHFAPRRGWINDPNGLVCFNGLWHLFYQFFDPADVDGMQWGHAVSGDLVRWEHRGPAIRPDGHGQIWSGSAVVDRHDSSGLFGGRPGIVCMFTYWNPSDGRQCQGLAFSPDGRTFTTYEGNPVIPELRHLPGHADDKDFRDPKIFWHSASSRWIMTAAGGKLRFFSSPDLIHWTFESVDGSIETECPDLFELAVGGNPARTRWVLSGGGRWYMLGRFDGRRFAPETERLTMAHGPDCYATQTWSDAPDGRRIAIAWLNSWRYGSGPRPGPRIENRFPTATWSGGCLTVPFELTLRQTPDGEKLVQLPIRELDALRQDCQAARQVCAEPGHAVPLHSLSRGAIDMDMIAGGGMEGSLTLNIPSSDGCQFVLTADLRRRQLILDRGRAGFGSIPEFAGRYEAPLPINADGSATLRVILDRCSIEVFAGDGLVQFSAVIWPNPNAELSLKTEGIPCRLRLGLYH